MTKTWPCEHIESSGILDLAQHVQERVWWLRIPHKSVKPIFVDESWKTCPICGAKRPEEPELVNCKVPLNKPIMVVKFKDGRVEAHPYIDSETDKPEEPKKLWERFEPMLNYNLRENLNHIEMSKQVARTALDAVEEVIEEIASADGFTMCVEFDELLRRLQEMR